MNSTISQNRPNFFAYLCGLTIGFVSRFSGNHRHHVRRSTPAMSGRSTSLDSTFISWFDLRDAYHLDPFGFYAGSNKISAPLLFPIIFNVLQPCTRAASRPRGQRVLAALRPCRGLAAPRLCRLAPSRALAAQHPRFAAPRPRRPTRAPRPSHPRRPAPSGSPRRASLRRRDDCEATAL